ncbi:MAG: serine hydrolase domain-containing protein [Candidatus Thorarchaeota archaeon]|jgi:CubicO group peptidase (beta-lactamase class C family)
MHTLVKILSVFVLVMGFFINPASYENNSLCPLQPHVHGQISDIMEQHYIPSTTVAVIRNNSVIWAKGYGEQQRLDLIYMIASVTKTFTATAIFQLYERDIIDLDDDVNDYLPFSFRHPNFTETPITFKMLLQHTSGLSKDSDTYWYGVMADILQQLGWENPGEWLPFPYWIEEYLTVNGSLYEPAVWTSHEPGTNRFYSNFGYNVLAYLIQRATGQPIWEYFQENIFDPLGMHSTKFNYTEFDTAQLAVPHIYMFDLDPTSTGNKAYPHYSTLSYGAGGLRSNIFDLAKFLLVFLHDGVSNGTRILEEETLRTMESLQTAWLAPGDPLIQWGGWGGTEGDEWAFHAKAYGYYGGNTTVPYGVITLVNQGLDSARDAAFSITKLLQEYVHQYDATAMDCPNGLAWQDAILIAASAGVVIMVLVVIVRRKMFS